MAGTRLIFPGSMSEHTPPAVVRRGAAARNKAGQAHSEANPEGSGVARI